ncbi:probable Ufm1-specific protease 2 [Toxorhynchites rutilus septentrionalis]|uniref:probable Ufm1-specific protease 2 n=1 Tax=Toxorhynchites rutilus septentrionalis TaxID=329112 RepID=UPI00247917CF|nr:probable Ufm1-specific protease 2 [Toxorhynchites rutilus septentrionalis]
MTPKLEISECVLQRIAKVSTQCSGELFGIMSRGTLTVLGFILEGADKTSALNYSKVQNNFPAEIDLCGLIKFGPCSDAEAHLSEILQDVDITDNPVLLNCDADGEVKASLFKHGQLEAITYVVVNETDLFRDYMFLRLQCDLELVCEQNEKSISENTFRLRKKLASGNVAFGVTGTSVVLNGGSSGSQVLGIEAEDTMEALFGLTVKINDDGFGTKGTKKKSVTNPTSVEYQILNINMLVKKSKDAQDEKLSREACNVTIDSKNGGNKIKIPLQVDVLSMLHRQSKVVLCYDILVESVCRSLRLLESSYIEQLQHLKQVYVTKCYHILPADLGHFFTCAYPVAKKIEEENEFLTKKRKALHSQFGLPANRPYFRRANGFRFNLSGSKLLFNPHVGVKRQLSDGKLSLVQGRYSYHHYMQDNFNDDGWGCAYRSLQTLISWFIYQGYADARIPTHNDIQKYLVRVGDKPSSFVGSRQWIGSTEVAMCLNEFVKVDSRIMHVSSGADMATKGSELAYHFETQGTPIMIGGGVLAHTILGVDFDRNTGNLKFLILDPHYTGADEIVPVQTKGWCGWKGVEFWDKKAYYNLCMPQRPYVF